MVTAAWPAKRRRYCSWRAASAYFCGSTTQTKASTTSTRRSTSARWPASTESWSGRSRSTRPWSSGDAPGGHQGERGLDDGGEGGGAGGGAQVLLVGGGDGVLLGVDHPDEGVDDLDEAVALGP